MPRGISWSFLICESFLSAHHSWVFVTVMKSSEIENNDDLEASANFAIFLSAELIPLLILFMGRLINSVEICDMYFSSSRLSFCQLFDGFLSCFKVLGSSDRQTDRQTENCLLPPVPPRSSSLVPKIWPTIWPAITNLIEHVFSDFQNFSELFRHFMTFHKFPDFFQKFPEIFQNLSHTCSETSSHKF